MENSKIDEIIRREHIAFYKYDSFENSEVIKPNVFRVTMKDSDKFMVLKSINLDDGFTIKDLVYEIKKHQKLEICENVVKFFGVTKQVLEYANEGSLQQYLKDNGASMNWEAKLNLARQIAGALKILHENDDSFHYTDSQYLEICNNIWRQKGSDVYNLGVVLWEISNDSEDTYELRVARNSLKATFNTSRRSKPHEYVEIYTDCWRRCESEHPGIEKIVEDLNKLDLTAYINEDFTRHEDVIVEGSKGANDVLSSDG
ncbi:17541_t:CDS:2, partial [Acaulospora colombiana]